MSVRAKFLSGVVGISALAVLIGIAFGSAGKNAAYQPQNEFKLDPWISIHIGSVDLSINKAVLYLVLAASATIATMRWIANRMEARPNRVQTAVEAAYSLMKDNIAGANMDRRMAKKWFAFVGALFLFIWFSNMIGYFPLPTNTEHKINILGAHIPADIKPSPGENRSNCRKLLGPRCRQVGREGRGRTHGRGEHHGLRRLHHQIEEVRRLLDRVGAVTDHDAVASLGVRLDCCPGEVEHGRDRDGEAGDGRKLAHLDVRDGGQPGDALDELGAGERRRHFRHARSADARDRPAEGEEADHVRK